MRTSDRSRDTLAGLAPQSHAAPTRDSFFDWTLAREAHAPRLCHRVSAGSPSADVSDVHSGSAVPPPAFASAAPCSPRAGPSAGPAPAGPFRTCPLPSRLESVKRTFLFRANRTFLLRCDMLQLRILDSNSECDRLYRKSRT